MIKEVITACIPIRQVICIYIIGSQSVLTWILVFSDTISVVIDSNIIGNEYVISQRICIIWHVSPTYNDASRIVVVYQVIGNG